MGNHAWAQIEGKHQEFFLEFCKGVKLASSRFGTLFHVEEYEDSIKASLISENQVIVDQEFFVNGSRVEWSHKPGALQWWFCETVAAQACRSVQDALGTQVLIGDDGIEEMITPEFDLKYPRFRDWEQAGLQHQSPFLKRLTGKLNEAFPSYPEIREVLDIQPDSQTVMHKR